MSLEHLKRKSASSFDRLNQELSKLNTKNSGQSDSRYWNLEVDKAGNGYAVIRFLPEIEGEDLPFVQVFSHSFQGPGGWYIEKSLSTIGQPDPCGEENSRLWNTGNESDKEIARKRKRKLKYHSNIYVVKDPANPENEGKVFLFEYGKKIFDKIKDLMSPSFEDEKPVNPFDFWEGANFKLKRRIVDDWPNYEKSEFDEPSALFDDDAKIEEVYSKQHSLKELVDPKNFKTYDKLKERLDKVLGNVSSRTSDEDEEETTSRSTLMDSIEEKKKEEPSLPAIEEDDDDDELQFFKDIADSDD